MDHEKKKKKNFQDEKMRQPETQSQSNTLQVHITSVDDRQV